MPTAITKTLQQVLDELPKYGQKLLARDAVDAELSFTAALIGSYVNFREFDGRPLDVETAKTERGVKVVAIDHDLTIGEFVDHVVFFDCAQAGGIQFGSDGCVLVKDGKVVVLGHQPAAVANVTASVN